MDGRLALLVVAAVTAGCLAPAETVAPLGAADPAAPGSLPVARELFDFGVSLATSPSQQWPWPVRVTGNVHYPQEGEGPFPLVVLMHGMHQTCDGVVPFGIGYPCPETPVTEPVNSFEGYDYLAEALAAAGYVVASVNANDVNDRDLTADHGDEGRARLALAALDGFARANATAGHPLEGRVDMGRVGLMGHSRGGEGVTRAVAYNAERPDGPRHAIKAVFALAPTDFYRHVVSDVAYATLLPYCDGDVWNLHGAWIYDDSRYAGADAAPRFQILVHGANHNWYNTLWTWDDASWADDTCGTDEPGRWSEEDQRAHGLVYMGGFFRAFVGGEEGFRALFEGAPPPPSACPAGRAACADLVHVSRHPAADDRLVLDATDGPAPAATNALGGAVALEGFARAETCVPPAASVRPGPVLFAGFVQSWLVPPPPATCHERTMGTATQLALEWRGPAVWRHEIPAAAGDFRAFDRLTLRVAVVPGHGAQDFTVRLVDGAGRAAAVPASAVSAALFEPPGDRFLKLTLNEVRFPLAGFAVDLGDVRRVEVAFDRTPAGHVQVTDVALQRS